MSQVFRYEEIQDSNVGCANESSFEVGIKTAFNELEALAEEGLITGALFFGSSTFKGTNPSSDIDTFVAVQEFDERTVTGLQSAVSHVAQTTGISLELTAYTVNQLKAGKHWERAAKANWLHEQARLYPELVVGCDPTLFITPLTKDLRKDVDEYLTDRAQEMTWSLIHGYTRTPELTLEKVFNTPHRTARKTLHVLSFLGYLPEELLPDMCKPTIARATEAVYGNQDAVIIDHQMDIRADFDRYLQLVEEVRMGTVSADEYNQMIHATLGEDLPKAIDFVTRIQPIYRRLAKLSMG